MPLLAATLLLAGHLGSPPLDAAKKAPFTDIDPIKSWYAWEVEAAKKNDAETVNALYDAHATPDFKETFPPTDHVLTLDELKTGLAQMAKDGLLSKLTSYKIQKIEGKGQPSWTITTAYRWTDFPGRGGKSTFDQIEIDTWIITQSGYRLQKTVMGARTAVPTLKLPVKKPGR